MTTRKINGLILTGGKSSRMGEPKALINYHGKAHARYLYDLLSPFCDQVYLSSQKDQWSKSEIADLPILEDINLSEGPTRGIISALTFDPTVSWLVVACDLVNLNLMAIQNLIDQLDNTKSDTVAICFSHHEKGFPEALCALYLPEAKAVFTQAIEQGLKCPVKILAQASILKIMPTERVDLSNINTQQERESLHTKEAKEVHIKYFAILRDEAGRPEESRFTQASNYRQLYNELKRDHKLSLSECMIQVAVNDAFTSLDTPITSNAKVVFIPPVAGG